MSLEAIFEAHNYAEAAGRPYSNTSTEWLPKCSFRGTAQQCVLTPQFQFDTVTTFPPIHPLLYISVHSNDTVNVMECQRNLLGSYN